MNEQPIQIGWGTRDITPDRPVIIRGQFHARLSQGVRDPLTVTAMALGSDDQQAVLVSIDRVGIPDHIRQGVRERTALSVPDLRPESIVLNATHTHCAPVTGRDIFEDFGDVVMSPEEYSELLISRTAEAIADAWNGRQTGAVAWGVGTAVVGRNRRQVRLDGSALMYGDTALPEFANIEGHEDHSVDLLYSFDPAGRLTGVVVNLACPSQVSESEYLLSADFWHETREQIQGRLGKGIFVLPQCSAAGDQSPHPMYYRRAEMRMLRLQGLVHSDNARGAAGQRQEIARRITNAVADALPVAKLDVRPHVTLRHTTRVFDLPKRWITEDDLAEAKREQATYLARYEALQDRPLTDVERSRCFGRQRWYGGVVTRHAVQETEPVLPMEAHILRVGDVVFATNQFELYLDYGIRMKARSKAIQTFVVQLAGPGTYLPSARSVAGGSYGSLPASNHVGAEGGDLLVEETLRAIRELFPEKESMADSPFQITTIGTGAVRVNPRRGGPCHLVEANGQRILVDCGRAAVHHLGQAGIPPESIDAVCLTHLHFDHVCDLPLLALLGWNNGRETGLRIIGPTGTERFLHHAIDETYADDIASRLAHGKDPAGLRWSTTEIQADGLCHQAGPLAVSCAHTPHAGLRNLNFRFDLDGRSVVITSDTNLTPELVELCRSADLLVCECSGTQEFLASVPWGSWHMNPNTVAQLAREAGVGRVLLAHLVVEDWSADPDISEKMAAAVRQSFAGPVAISTDGGQQKVC